MRDDIRDANVCVVGGAGFLGSHLVNHLIDDRNCDVLVLDNLCAGRREFVHPEATFFHCDITQSEEYLRKQFRRCGVQFVFNYAAHPYVPDSFARPKHVFEVNATGAINVINAAQEAGVKAILQVSSAELYGSAGKFWMSGNPIVEEDYTYKIAEGHPVVPHSTYGAAKAAVDYYCQSAWRERKTPVIALRQFNCIGERETHPYVVPEIISQLMIQTKNFVWCPGDLCISVATDKAQKEIIPTVKLGNNSFRDFLYAGDAVRIAVELLERGSFGDVYNLGSETGIKMYDLAKLVGKLMGFSDVKVEVDESRKRPWEIWSLLADNTKINSVLKACGHLTKCAEDSKLTPLEEALKRTIAYYEQSGRKWCWEK